MITSDSRYQDAVKAFSTGHIYDQYGRLLLSSEGAVPTPRSGTHETLYRLTIPTASAPPPLEYPIKEGESLPFLSWKLTRSHANWWQLAEANPHIWYPLDIPQGTKIRIPL